MIEVRNARYSAEYPGCMADVLILHTPAGDIPKHDCALEWTVRKLLFTTYLDHEGENGPNDNALLIGDCGDPGCCGQDFGVRHRGDVVELSWADREELGRLMERAARERPDEAIFPNEFTVTRHRVEVPSRTYASAVLGLARDYLALREGAKDPDEKTRALYEWVRAKFPEIAV